MTDFSSVTETNEAGLTRHAFAMNCHRYRFALDYCGGKDVLEVACGSGQGLGYLARQARNIVGGDFTENLVNRAFFYGKLIPLPPELQEHSAPFDIPKAIAPGTETSMYRALYAVAHPTGKEASE